MYRILILLLCRMGVKLGLILRTKHRWRVLKNMMLSLRGMR